MVTFTIITALVSLRHNNIYSVVMIDIISSHCAWSWIIHIWTYRLVSHCKVVSWRFILSTQKLFPFSLWRNRKEWKEIFLEVMLFRIIFILTLIEISEENEKKTDTLPISCTHSLFDSIFSLSRLPFMIMTGVLIRNNCIHVFFLDIKRIKYEITESRSVMSGLMFFLISSDFDSQLHIAFSVRKNGFWPRKWIASSLHIGQNYDAILSYSKEL